MPRRCAECGASFETDIRYCPMDHSPTITVEDEDSLIGKVVDNRFSIKALLGVGGMGAVYTAQQFSMNRDVALKLLKRHLTENTDAIRRFMREARAASRLTNPHAITVFDFGQTSDGLLYIVMELLRGQSLADMMFERPGPLEPCRAVRMCLQVLDALVEAHDYGILHRDLKPGNLFLLQSDTPEDFVKVLDFGLAKMVETEGSKITASGMIFGTPEYMAPEQASGEDTDPRSDLYAVGVILFEMLTGRMPFQASTPMMHIVKKVNEDAPPLGAVKPDLAVPESLEKAVASLLARDPRKRPASARVARRILAACLDSWEQAAPRPADVPVVSVGLQRNTEPMTRIIPPDTSEKVIDAELKAMASLKRPSRPVNRRAIWIGAGVVAVTLGGAGILFSMAGSGDRESTDAAPVTVQAPDASATPDVPVAARDVPSAPVASDDPGTATTPAHPDIGRKAAATGKPGKKAGREDPVMGTLRRRDDKAPEELPLKRRDQ